MFPIHLFIVRPVYIGEELIPSKNRSISDLNLLPEKNTPPQVNGEGDSNVQSTQNNNNRIQIYK